MDKHSNEYYMAVALEEAKKGQGAVEPNPMVGAVIVEDNQIVARGYYEKDGGPHAERNALKQLGRKPQSGAVMFVTLEPCSTHGRTGACTDALIDSGISKVVMGAIDPNPDHQGRGINILKEAGIEVQAGVLEEECTEINSAFNERMQSKAIDKK